MWVFMNTYSLSLVEGHRREERAREGRGAGGGGAEVKRKCSRGNDKDKKSPPARTIYARSEHTDHG